MTDKNKTARHDVRHVQARGGVTVMYTNAYELDLTHSLNVT